MLKNQANNGSGAGIENANSEEEWEQHYKNHYKDYGYDNYADYVKKQIKNTFDFIMFDSIAQTENYQIINDVTKQNSIVREWVGKAGLYTVVIIYKTGQLFIGIGRDKTGARSNIQNVANSPNPDSDMTLTKIIKELELTWKLPDGFVN